MFGMKEGKKSGDLHRNGSNNKKAEAVKCSQFGEL